MADHRRADYRFARRRVWIAGHLLAAVLLVTFLAAGFWQLRRLDQRREINAAVEARTAVAPEPVGDLVHPGDTSEELDEVRFRAVSASGRYLAVGTAVRSSQGGAGGGRVFTVLDLGGGESVAVLRGFVSPQPDGSLSAPPPPGGTVELLGIAYPRRRLEPITRQALDELEADAPGLLPVVVQAVQADSDGMVPVPPPELDEGPHLAYAVQWFLFFGVGAVGYPVLLRRRALEEGAAADG